MNLEKTITLEGFVKQAEEHAAGCWDTRAQVQAMEYSEGQLTFPIESEFEDLFNGAGSRRATLPLRKRA